MGRVPWGPLADGRGRTSTLRFRPAGGREGRGNGTVIVFLGHTFGGRTAAALSKVRLDTAPIHYDSEAGGVVGYGRRAFHPHIIDDMQRSYLNRDCDFEWSRWIDTGRGNSLGSSQAGC